MALRSNHIQALILAGFLAFGAVVAPAPASAAGRCTLLMENPVTEPARWRQVGKDDSFFEFLRANARHFQAWSRTHAEKFLGRFLEFEGVVVGDMSVNNLSLINIKDILRMIVADFDDGGTGSFVLDLAHHIVTTRALTDDIKRKDFTDAYVAGLRGEKIDPPAAVAKLLELSKTDVREIWNDYVEENTKDGKLRLDTDEFKSFEGRSSVERLREGKIKARLKELVAPRELLDAIKIVKDSGGSAGVTRYRTLVRPGSTGRETILEFKGIAEPATSAYRKQLGPAERFSMLLKQFWKQIQAGDPNYEVVTIEDEFFWMRLKPVWLIEIPHQAESGKDEKFIRDLSLYQANLLGHLHGSQDNGRAYLKAVEENLDAFYNAVHDYAKEYQDLAEAAYQH